MPSENPIKEIYQTLDLIDQRGKVDDTVDFERPTGSKAEKANWKRKDDEKDFSTKYLKKKLKILEESCAHEKEKVRILCMVMRNIEQNFMAKLQNTSRTIVLILHKVFHP